MRWLCACSVWLETRARRALDDVRAIIYKPLEARGGAHSSDVLLAHNLGAQLINAQCQMPILMRSV